MKKTCLIYGQNGLDLDVTFNLWSFFRKLGYHAYFDTKLHSANIISIVRGVDTAINLDGVEFDQIYVFDYGGWNYDDLVKSLPFDKTYILTTALETKKRLVHSLCFPENKIFVVFPPVDIDMFSSKLRPIKYKLIHIGNYKNDEDPYLKRMKTIINVLDVKIWGMNWHGHIESENKLMGRSGFFETSRIYSQSMFALGLMYPFQRNITFSGRFWQAPLNGCYLLSEPGLYSHGIPGIIETDYSLNDIKLKLETKLESRKRLILEAKNYWKANNEKLKGLIKTINEEKCTMQIGRFHYYKYHTINVLRLYFHKLNINILFHL